VVALVKVVINFTLHFPPRVYTNPAVLQVSLPCSMNQRIIAITVVVPPGLAPGSQLEDRACTIESQLRISRLAGVGNVVKSNRVLAPL
jgi:hypothetical protein